MTTYILRRLLLMIPTVIGMTLLVFLLVAASPGGVGAALTVAAGGQMDSSTRAAQQAYLEDRYGLDDPVLMQYLRWAGRVSPIKFGQRDLVASGGEIISPPKAIKPMPVWWFYLDATPRAATESFSFSRETTDEERARAYRRASNDFARARFSYLRAKTDFELALGAILRETGRGTLVKDDGTLRSISRRALSKADVPGADDGELAAKFEAMRDAYAAAVQSRERLQAVFDARPFRRAGFGISGVVWFGAPDLGMSFSRSRPVSALIKEALPVTLLLNLLAFPIIYAIAIPTGMLAATRQGSWFDVGSGAFFVALWSVPVVWAGVLAMGYLANQVTGLGAFPVAGLNSNDADSFTFLPTTLEDGSWHRGYLLDSLWHVALPVACLVYGGFAVLSKQTRAAMLDNFNADYVRTAKAKGVPGHQIVLRHVFRNSLLPLITMFVSVFPAMLGGSVVVERIFSVPGMGSLIIDAIFLRDREVLLANALIVGLVNMLALLVADILYALADPRISYN